MSSDALERRESIHELCIRWMTVPGLPENAIPASPDDVLWLLAEVARLVQERERPGWCVNERCPWPGCDCLPPHAVNALEATQADLAAARAREQRLRGLVELALDAIAHCDGPCGTAHLGLRAALAAEPAADAPLTDKDYAQAKNDMPEKVASSASAAADEVLGHCPHGVNLDRAFCPEGCRV